MNTYLITLVREVSMRKNSIFTGVVVAMSALGLVFAPSASAAGTTWKASGATSVSTILDLCKPTFQKATGDDYNYGAGGSSAGKANIKNNTSDFTFSDSVDAAPVANEIHLPTFVWPVALLTNLGGNKTPVTLSTDTAAKIFAGKITMWNDPAIVADNNRSVKTIVYKKINGKIATDKTGNPIVLRTQNVTLRRTMPSKPITVIYRSEGSGTSDNLTMAFKALAPSLWTASSSTFASAFPGGSSALANLAGSFRGVAASSGVALEASRTAYSITYAEVGFASSPYNLGIANILNKAGNAITPSASSAMAAAAQATVKTDGTVTFKYDSTDPDAYPFTATTYALALTDYKSETKAKGVKEALEYIAFNCAKDTASNSAAAGFGIYTEANAFAKAFRTQLAKLGK